MLLLTAFALLAGAGTALSPCVLPMLPALLSAAGSGGRRRPVGVVIGLVVTFAVTIVGLSSVVGGVGLGAGALRYVAVAALAGFGLAMALPALGDRLEAALSRIARLGPRTRGDGLVSGLAVGAALGFVYTPCAGPILAAVISVGAASSRAFVVGIAYALGTGAALLALALGGRRVLDAIRARGRGPGLQRALGAVMVLTAVVMATKLDVRLDQQIAAHLPDVSLTAALEDSGTVKRRLTELRPRSRFAIAQDRAASSAPAAAAASTLPALGPAPDFARTQRWFNTPGGARLSMAGLRGRVVLIDFWTYTCINCLRTLPYLEAWDARYRSQGLTVVGVHSPEFSFEQDAGNVADAIRRLGVRYPVVQDNELATWQAWGNDAWPSEYLVDASGQVRHVQVGEGDYAGTEAAIRALLAAAGARLGPGARPRGVVTPSLEATPETYLGAARAARWAPGPPTPGSHRFASPPRHLGPSRFAYSGSWRITGESATAGAGAGIDAQVTARDVYLVLSSAAGRPRRVQVRLDGRPVGAGRAGADVHAGAVTVRGERLYTLVSLPSDQTHRLALRFEPGVSGYAFTFG
jgi:cytochrome c biogenesis protein CcdA/thiol-disulfide isomerase/thioredoxin